MNTAKATPIFVDRLATMLTACNIPSVEQFAKHLAKRGRSIPPRTLLRYVNGSRVPSSVAVADMAVTLVCSTDYLLGLTNNPHPHITLEEAQTMLYPCLECAEVYHHHLLSDDAQLCSACERKEEARSYENDTEEIWDDKQEGEKADAWENACLTCENGMDIGDCPQSSKSCKHHCNCAWVYDYCCDCQKEWVCEDHE